MRFFSRLRSWQSSRAKPSPSEKLSIPVGLSSTAMIAFYSPPPKHVLRDLKQHVSVWLKFDRSVPKRWCGPLPDVSISGSEKAVTLP
ncbi:hypothetical protein COCCADRAFT_99081 [Bipolaris zeicola 26-R-13]|uniref:Uncharacterized protein n=1 Tax=Cochliobolus carbonum (strain 26-R-13) TaxID=930089 RepID=W6XXY2_COCC2|nr:uncharacterized protein COCCADRAFT_99081 [Bipolaris zeicola 26-R-13]EUC32312.1 hypothetical protein COCCADRAFT_99081 [Bipolaris zeicola 26-R-13]